MLRRKPDDPNTSPKCSVDGCHLPMFASGAFWLCSNCDMVTEEEIATRKS